MTQQSSHFLPTALMDSHSLPGQSHLNHSTHTALIWRLYWRKLRAEAGDGYRTFVIDCCHSYDKLFFLFFLNGPVVLLLNYIWWQWWVFILNINQVSEFSSELEPQASDCPKLRPSENLNLVSSRCMGQKPHPLTVQTLCLSAEANQKKAGIKWRAKTASLQTVTNWGAGHEGPL